MRKFRIITSIVLFVCCFGCRSSQDQGEILKQIFNEREMVEIDKIIDYYDNYVISHTKDTTLSLEKAYEQFAEKNTPLTLTGNSVFVPPLEERIAFFNTLDTAFLSSIFHVADTIYIYESGIFVEAKYRPLFGLKCCRYLEFMKLFVSKSDFFMEYYDSVESVYDFSPRLYTTIFRSYFNEEGHTKPYKKAFDFSNKDERFTFIAPFLFIQDIYCPSNMHYQYKIKYKDLPVEKSWYHR